MFRLWRHGGLEACGSLAGDVVGVAVPAQGQVPGRPGAAAGDGLLPALVGELLPAPLAYGALLLPLGGTAPLLLRVGAGGLVAVEGVAVGVVERGRQQLLARPSPPPPHRRARPLLLELLQGPLADVAASAAGARAEAVVLARS